MRHRCTRFAGAALLLAAALVHAQSTGGGTIAGSVLDVTGKPIPGAVVNFKNGASGAVRNATSASAPCGTTTARPTR